MKKKEIYFYVAAHNTSLLLVLSLSFTGDCYVSCACQTAYRTDIECGGRSSTKSIGIRLHNISDVSASHQSGSWQRHILNSESMVYISISGIYAGVYSECLSKFTNYCLHITFDLEELCNFR